MGTKIESAIFTREDDNEDIIFYESLDTDLYEEKYKNKLTCVNGCVARIKFTQRKNGIKFFSTWNREGTLHDEKCQYHVNYKNKMGRKKLKALNEDVEVDTDHIKATIRRKIKSLKELNKKGSIKEQRLTTIEVDNNGVIEVAVGVDGKSEAREKIKNVYIGSLDAEYLDPSYVETRKCVYGDIENVQIKEDKTHKKYAYLNLKNTRHDVSVYFPEAFYAKENNDISKFESFIEVLKGSIEKNSLCQFIGVGFIKYKKKSGINIVILDKDHFVVNEKNYDELLRKSNL